MAIAQDAFFIPDDIATGLATGIYRRIGSVVRWATSPNKGQIVKHLKPIDLSAAEQVQGVGAKALQFVKQHKKGTIIVVASAVAVGAGAWVCNKVKNHEPKVVTEFRASLKSYIDVEFGTTNPLTILLQRNGFSRESATHIRNHRDEYVVQDETGEDLKLKS